MSTDLPPELRLRWETATRFYEVLLEVDLLGDCVLLQRWGGLFNRRGTCFIKSVNEPNVIGKISQITKRRIWRGYRQTYGPTLIEQKTPLLPVASPMIAGC